MVTQFHCRHAVRPGVLNSRIRRGCPRLIPSSDCSHCPTASLSLDKLDTSVSQSSPHHAFHSELSAPPDNMSRFQCSVTASLFRFSVKQQSHPPLPCCECMRWDVTYTHVFCARRRAAGFVTHVHTRSDCVHTRDDAVRLDYASRFVRVIYSSHVVSIKLGTVTPSVVVDWQ